MMATFLSCLGHRQGVTYLNQSGGSIWRRLSGRGEIPPARTAAVRNKALQSSFAGTLSST